MLVAQLIRDRHALECRGHRLWVELNLRAGVDKSGDRIRQEVLRGDGAYNGSRQASGLGPQTFPRAHVVRVDDVHVEMIWGPHPYDIQRLPAQDIRSSADNAQNIGARWSPAPSVT